MPRKLIPAIIRFLTDRSGNVIITAALALPVVLGAFGLGAEGASWFATKRALQNAADAAAIAAATNAGPTYDSEAKGVAAQYGQQDGTNGVTVTTSNAAPCPAGAGTGPCYSVTVSRPMPLMLAQVVGYQGNAKLNGGPAQLVSATAVAIVGPTTRSYCILALASSGASTALLTNGAPMANLSGCNVMSNTGATCNGHNTGADVGDAHTTNNGCGVVQHSGVNAAPDPYADLSKNIPPDPCNGSYPQEPTTTSGTQLPSKNRPIGAVSWGGVTTMCGDVQLRGDVTVGQNTTLVIYNGQLDLNGATLQSAAGVGMTIVFAGSNGSYIHAPTGGGTLDFAAPDANSSSPWQGIAMFQAPNLNTGVNIAAAGNSPTWDITGAVYLPNAQVIFSGAVNKASNGQSCFAMVVDTLRINGTAAILAHGQCKDAGVTQPTAKVPGRGQLVS
jgi:hypothetical protein